MDGPRVAHGIEKAVHRRRPSKRGRQALPFLLAGNDRTPNPEGRDLRFYADEVLLLEWMKSLQFAIDESLPNPGWRLIVSTTGPAMSLMVRLLAVISLTTALYCMCQGAEPSKQKQAASANARGVENKPVHLVVRSQADIKQTFTYSPRPAIPDELQGYAGTQVGGTGTYRMVVDPKGTVTQVSILNGFTVTAVYDERMSDVKGNAVPDLDKVMIQALQRWRAKPGPMRIVDIYWSFGPQPWVNYGKGNAPK